MFPSGCSGDTSCELGKVALAKKDHPQKLFNNLSFLVFYRINVCCFSLKAFDLIWVESRFQMLLVLSLPEGNDSSK